MNQEQPWRIISYLRWRRKRDSNPREPFDSNGFQDRRIQPLCHSSVYYLSVCPGSGEVRRALGRVTLSAPVTPSKEMGQRAKADRDASFSTTNITIPTCPVRLLDPGNPDADPLAAHRADAGDLVGLRFRPLPEKGQGRTPSPGKPLMEN